MIYRLFSIDAWYEGFNESLYHADELSIDKNFIEFSCLISGMVVLRDANSTSVPFK